MSKKVNVVPQLLSLYTLQGSAPGLADTVTMGTVWHRLCPTHLLLPLGSCFITCESSHARRGKALVPIYPGPLRPLTWPLGAFSQVTTVSLNRLEDLGWHFKYFLFTVPLERDLAISKKSVCIYPLNQQSHFEDSTPRILFRGRQNNGAPKTATSSSPQAVATCSYVAKRTLQWLN